MWNVKRIRSDWNRTRHVYRNAPKLTRQRKELKNKVQKNPDATCHHNFLSFLVVVLAPGNSITAPTTFSYFRFLKKKQKKKCLVSSWHSCSSELTAWEGGNGGGRSCKRRKTHASSREREKEKREALYLYTFSLFTLASSQSAAATRKKKEEKIFERTAEKLFIKRQCGRRRSQSGMAGVEWEMAAVAHDRGEAIEKLKTDKRLSHSSSRQISHSLLGQFGRDWNRVRKVRFAHLRNRKDFHFT